MSARIAIQSASTIDRHRHSTPAGTLFAAVRCWRLYRRRRRQMGRWKPTEYALSVWIELYSCHFILSFSFYLSFMMDSVWCLAAVWVENWFTTSALSSWLRAVCSQCLRHHVMSCFRLHQLLEVWRQRQFSRVPSSSPWRLQNRE